MTKKTKPKSVTIVDLVEAERIRLVAASRLGVAGHNMRVVPGSTVYINEDGSYDVLVTMRVYEGHR